jgi:hypothetical protein
MLAPSVNQLTNAAYKDNFSQLLHGIERNLTRTKHGHLSVLFNNKNTSISGTVL